jgi:hypothetical protein
MIESYNGWWQARVWSRFAHAGLEDLRRRSDRHVQALRRQRVARIEAAPDRRAFPTGWQLDLKKRPQGRVVYLRRSNGLSQVALLGQTWDLEQVWPNRLVRCEVDLDRGQIRFYALRRREPKWQPLLQTVPYQVPTRRFQE